MVNAVHRAGLPAGSDADALGEIDRRPRPVLLRDDADRQRPGDAEDRVVVTHAAFGAGGIGVGDRVEHVGLVGERLEAVREADRDVERAAILGGELEALPLQVGGGGGAQVDDDVEHRARDAAHELDLAVRRRLEVHAADGALGAVVGMVALNEPGDEPVVGELTHAEGAGEEAARVLVALHVDDHRVGEARLAELHTPLQVRLRGRRFGPRAMLRDRGSQVEAGPPVRRPSAPRPVSELPVQELAPAGEPDHRHRGDGGEEHHPGEGRAPVQRAAQRRGQHPRHRRRALRGVEHRLVGREDLHRVRQEQRDREERQQGGGGGGEGVRHDPAVEQVHRRGAEPRSRQPESVQADHAAEDVAGRGEVGGAEQHHGDDDREEGQREARELRGRSRLLGRPRPVLPPEMVDDDIDPVQQAPEDEGIARPVPEPGDQHGGDGGKGENVQEGERVRVAGAQHRQALRRPRPGQRQRHRVVDVGGQESGQRDVPAQPEVDDARRLQRRVEVDRQPHSEEARRAQAMSE